MYGHLADSMLQIEHKEIINNKSLKLNDVTEKKFCNRKENHTLCLTNKTCVNLTCLIFNIYIYKHVYKALSPFQYPLLSIFFSHFQLESLNHVFPFLTQHSLMF